MTALHFPSPTSEDGSLPASGHGEVAGLVEELVRAVSLRCHSHPGPERRSATERADAAKSALLAVILTAAPTPSPVEARADGVREALAFIEGQARNSRYGVTIELLTGQEGESYGFRFGRQGYLGPVRPSALEAIEAARDAIEAGLDR